MADDSRYALPCVLLHPEPGLHGPEESGLGGTFAWPKGQRWPEDGKGVPFQGGLQLWRRDFPELPFPEGSDLLQLFWLPVWDWRGAPSWFETERSFRGRWASSGTAWEGRREEHPAWSEELSVRPCRLRPERLLDEPGSTLEQYLKIYVGGDEYSGHAWAAQRHRVSEFERMIEGIGTGEFFRPEFPAFRAVPEGTDEREPAEGMKLLGHPYPIQGMDREEIECEGCQAPMMLLFSSGNIHATREAAGLVDVDGMAYVFVCVRCAERPLRSLVRRS